MTTDPNNLLFYRSKLHPLFFGKQKTHITHLYDKDDKTSLLPSINDEINEILKEEAIKNERDAIRFAFVASRKIQRQIKKNAGNIILTSESSKCSRCFQYGHKQNTCGVNLTIYCDYCRHFGHCTSKCGVKCLYCFKVGHYTEDCFSLKQTTTNTNTTTTMNIQETTEVK